MVKNDMKQFWGLTEMELDMAADQILTTRDGEDHPRHTLKTVCDWAVNRKKKNETYIAMAQCLDVTPLYIVKVDQKETIDHDRWRVWKFQNGFGKLQQKRLVDLLGAEYLLGAMNPTKKKIPIAHRFKEEVKNILGTHDTKVTLDHVVLSIDNKYKCSGGKVHLPILHAYMDTRFLP